MAVDSHSSSRRLRVLSLDGGGVRGLSALLILRKLLCMINEELFGTSEPMLPQLVFDIIVGTSTGGLIALMVVKLGMTVDECIKQYESLSREIFGKPHRIGKRTGGFGTTKYSGTRMRELVVELIESRDEPADYKMEDTSRHPDLLCSVVCRELENNYTRARRGDAVFLCSHECRKRPFNTQKYEECEMADAGRATSAAPTYFDPVRIMKKILVDGGYGETNNPSQDAWRHYLELKEIVHTDQVRWVNIGTGTCSGQSSPPRRTWKDLLLPNYFQNIMHTLRDLEKIATDSENTGVSMRLISDMDRSQLDFHRFSATNGVHAIALDDYLAIENKELEGLTLEYLEEPKVDERLRALAHSLANDYVEKTRVRRATLEIQYPHMAPKPSSIRQLVTGEQPEYLDRLSPGTGVPSMAGTSEITAETSNAEDTPRSGNAVLDGSFSMVPTQGDSNGVGDQFKTPEVGATELGPPTRSSTAPARV